MKPLIMIIDDDPMIRETITLRLELQNFKVVSAASGDDALLQLKSVIPDLIVLDLTMPKMNGFEVCKLLKENKETARIPVIFLTAAGSEMETKLQSLMVGAVDYLAKPFEGEELVTTIKKHLKS
ncbi:MAG: response regulator [Candidatus Aureabacteria bacterium]|nr:response regulator [Candidatus Auribacterota bacterium]